jgi:hypothetical protein
MGKNPLDEEKCEILAEAIEHLWPRLGLSVTIMTDCKAAGQCFGVCTVYKLKATLQCNSALMMMIITIRPTG